MYIIYVLGYIMASKLYNLIVGGVSIGTSAYFTTWLLTGENPAVRIILIILNLFKKINNISVI